MAAATKFKIDVAFQGGLTASQQAAFVAAAARWERVVVKPLPAVKVNGIVTTGCRIEARGAVIDGGGGILGMAGPTRLRPNLSSMGKAAYLPCAGMMTFDTADLVSMERDGTLVDVITHEMGHVLGIGTVWQRKGVLAGAGSLNPIFVGLACRHEWHNIGGLGNDVPVENTGGGGTRDSHWRERQLRNELMTGWVSPAGTKNPLSAITIGSLADLGYDVDLSAADPFVVGAAMLASDEVLVPRRHCVMICGDDD